MGQSCFDVIYQIDWLLQGIVIVIFLIVVIEVNKVHIVVAALLPLRAVFSKVSLLPALEGEEPRWVNKERGREGNKKNRGPTSLRIVTQCQRTTTQYWKQCMLSIPTTLYYL